MAIPINELTEIDIDILDYINKFDSVSKKQLLEKFDKKVEAFEFRLEILSEHDYKTLTRGKVSSRFQIPDSSYIVEEFDLQTDEKKVARRISKNTFHISPLGKKTLQDFNRKKKDDKKELWLVNAKIPIMVAFLTTVATNYLLPLLPLILQWFVDLLSSILLLLRL